MEMNPGQQPIPSGYGPTTTTREVLGTRRLNGWNVIVTGGYAGIGLETTRALAGAGAHVLVPARSLAKARAAIGELANVELAELDLTGAEAMRGLRRPSKKRMTRNVLSPSESFMLRILSMRLI